MMHGPSRIQLAIAALLVLILMATAGNLLAGYESYRHFGQQYAAQQAAQRSQGQQTEQKLCTTLSELAALRPPSGTAQANPSRDYEQRLHAVLAGLGPDIGCPHSK